MRFSWLSIGLGLAAMACGSGDGAGGEPVANDPSKLTFTTPEFEVPTGDSFTCFYTDTYTDREIAVASATGNQDTGGHHILAFWTDVPREAQAHECNDAEMVSWHQIAGSAGKDVGGAVLGLEDGLAVQIPAGVQLVLQAHYINTTTSPKKVHDTVTLNLVEPADVVSYVKYFVTDDETFELTPHSKGMSVTYCDVPRDFSMALSLGHMHELGTRYRLEVVDAADAVQSTIIDNEWDPEFTSHPEVLYYGIDDPLLLKKGTRLKQTCDWNNLTANPVIFPREMCLAFFYYFPGDDDMTCDMVKP